MMELVPEFIDGKAVVFNVAGHCFNSDRECEVCAEYAVGFHNWLISSTHLKYLIVDLQDEKEVCPVFLEQLLQLRKRLRLPFYFIGVMRKPRAILESYGYHSHFPISNTPEEAISFLRVDYPSLPLNHFEGIEPDQPIHGSKLKTA